VAPLPVLLVALAALAAAPARARADEAPRGEAELVSLRFAWPQAARAKVTYRRTRVRPGQKPGTFTARYETLADAGGEKGELRVSVRGTAWRGDLPVPTVLAPEAIRAAETVVQRVRAQGEFAGLEGVEALRPVLARVLEDARIPPEQSERALALAVAAARAEAEEIWNLAVGFWSGADLRIGETYELQSEAELPLLPGVRVPQAVQFGVRRRVPCSAAERAPRCVEVVLRSTPDRAALERAAPALLARLRPRPPDADADEDADADADADEAPPGPAQGLAAERALVLVTDPATLLPRRVVWTKAVTLGGADHGPPLAEEIDRSEWDYRWLPPPKPPRQPARRRAPPPAALEHPAPPA
jgi:hypothetical protein